MEAAVTPAPRRRRLLAKFTGAALLGFAASALALHLGLEAGLRPWVARLISLICAMHVTFLINGRFVFKALTRRKLFGQWAAYMANSAVGNLCNYWVFITLQATHWPIASNPYVALLAGAVTAWAINFTGARFLVFGELGRHLRDRCLAAFSRRAPVPVPESVEPGSSPP